MSDPTLELEAAAFRRLLEHLGQRSRSEERRVGKEC